MKAMGGKTAPFVMQAGDGKLYILGTCEGPPFILNCPQCNPASSTCLSRPCHRNTPFDPQMPQEEDPNFQVSNFQVLDPRVGEWSPLPHPPFVYPCTCNRPTRFLSQAMGPSSYANAGSKIFVWRQNTPMYCFDVTDPEKGWTKLSAYVPNYNSHGNALILNVNNNGDSNDGGLLMFTCTPTPTSRYRCSVFHHMLSSSGDEEYNWTVVANWPMLDKSQLPSGFGDLPTDYRFIHLGARQICLILTYFTCAIHDECGMDCIVEPEKMAIVLVTFKYKFTKTKECASFSYKTFRPRIIEYDTNWAHKEDKKSHTRYGNMIGAFLLNGGSVNGESNEEVMTEDVSSEAFKLNPAPVYPAARPIPHIPPPPSPPPILNNPAARPIPHIPPPPSPARPIPHIPPLPSLSPILNNPAYPSTPHDFRAANPLSSFWHPPVLPSAAFFTSAEHNPPTQPSSFWPPPVPSTAALVYPPTHHNPPAQILQSIYNCYFMAPQSSSIQTDHISAPLTSVGDHPRPTGPSSSSGPAAPTLVQPVQPLTPTWSFAGWSFGAPAGIVFPPFASTARLPQGVTPSEAANPSG